MATKATENPVLRQVNGQSYHELIVGVTEHYLLVRPKGTHAKTSQRSIPWGALYQLMVERDLITQRRAKRAGKPAKKRPILRG